MAFDEFHCVVIGNEPAGLWLLSALDRAYREVGEEPRLGWVSTFSGPTSVVLPAAFAPGLGLGPAATWSAEVVTPRESIPWNMRTLTERHRELSIPANTQEALQSIDPPSKADWTSVRTAISQCPDLIALAQGLWKVLGRSQTQSPETLVHYARYFTTLQWWDASTQVPSSVERFSLSENENAIESFQSNRKTGFSIQFKNHAQMTSKNWIVNCDSRSVVSLSAACPDFFSLLNLYWDPTTVLALYPLRLLVEKEAIPAPVSPLTLRFDTDLIPDPETEIWPLSLRVADDLRELTLWVSAPAVASLEAILERFRQGMSRVNRLFPFLPQKLVQQSVPLGMDSCFDQGARREIADALVASSHEIYQRTGFNTDTRSSAVSLLMPHLGCQLPYPLGSLKAAREMVPRIVGRKKKPLAPEIRVSPTP